MQPLTNADPEDSRRQLAALLRARKEELMVRWTRRVLDDPQVPEANALAALDLRDHMPRLLDRLARGLESSGVGEAGGRTMDTDSIVREHARHRAAKGYLITEALRELSHFRIAILDACRAEGVTLEGDAAKYLHTAIDESMITGGEEMERAALAALERQAAFRERFIAILGHDLRNPLQSILFVAESLLDHDVTEIQGHLVHRLTESANRMSRMIADVLDLTRARLGGGIPVDPRPADLGSIVRQAVEELEIARPDKGAVRGSWDPDRMAQVVSNLVSNALDYSPEGAPVAVRVREDGDGVILVVHNEGPPIAPEALPSLFDPFVQGEHAVPGEGLGLGLFIAQQIVLSHGGSIDVHSAAGEGTAFTVRLPRRD
jgi:signal transduction histidine kinase